MADQAATPGTQGKGRPTPKRSEKVKRRSGPVAPPPRTRKEAAQRRKQELKEARGTARARSASGDERYMVKRDAGPVRRLVRDTVDGRRNVGVLLLPLALVLVLAQLTQNRALLDVALALWLAGVLAMLLDVVVTGALIRRRVKAAFPQEGRMARHIGYGLLRSTVFRRWRLPAPTVKPGRRG